MAPSGASIPRTMLIFPRPESETPASARRANGFDKLAKLRVFSAVAAVLF
jgi:hypothetical protein